MFKRLRTLATPVLLAGLLAVPLADTAQAQPGAGAPASVTLCSEPYLLGYFWGSCVQVQAPSQPGTKKVASFTAQSAKNPTRYKVRLYTNSNCEGPNPVALASGAEKRSFPKKTVTCVKFSLS
ncbi:hypothetical protein [Streptomyces sp. 6N223]|uniref:hypothetical protein n=1 Tax=Streptomyces sp. 6N223 TaxID=3457412 RepID=UPI003FD243E1